MDDAIALDTCYACGGAEAERKVGVNHMRICTRCGMGRIPGDPMMHAYWTQEDPDESLNEVYWHARRRMFRNALHHLEQSGGPGKVLDLGGGAGHFAEIALELGCGRRTQPICPTTPYPMRPTAWGRSVRWGRPMRPSCWARLMP